MKINLPVLTEYKKSFEEKGASLPLKNILIPAEGLLYYLPNTENQKGFPWNEQTNPLNYDKKKKWPKISIITPSYNQGKFIEETIRSVLLQNYPNLEYIIIDGGSTDNTNKILEKYSPWISYYQSEKDKGQSQAINRGFSIASGEIFAWLNSDDYYLPDTLFKVATTFIATKAKFVYGYAINHNVVSHKKELQKVLPYLDVFLRIPTLAQPSCFWKSEIHQPLWEELHCSLDYELWLRLVKGKKRKLIKEPLSVAQAHEDAKTHDPKMKAKWQHDHELICGENAHGGTPYWKYQVFLNNIFKKVLL